MQAPQNSRVQIGVPHKKQHNMLDEKQLTKEGGCHKINAIKVYTNDKYVLGIVMYYKLADGDYLKAGHNVPKEKKVLKKSNKIKSRVFEIGPDDYLKEIAGHYDNANGHICRLTFTSYRGKIGNYGSDLGTPFKHSFNNMTFGPFNSGFKDYLDFLDVPVIPCPQTFLNEFRPVTVNVNISEQQQRDKKQAYKPMKGEVFQGYYVNSSSAPSSQYGSVKMPTFNIPMGGQPQQQYPQQPVQQPQQYYQPPPPQQQPQQPYVKPQQPQQPQNNGSNNNSITKSQYPSF